MNDHRGVSARPGGASGQAPEATWRVALGDNRVESMTPAQISQAYRAGQLTERTPLWPPGTTRWQALGEFEQFRPAVSAGPPSLSSYDEADDDPTRMWTGPVADAPPAPPAPAPALAAPAPAPARTAPAGPAAAAPPAWGSTAPVAAPGPPFSPPAAPAAPQHSQRPPVSAPPPVVRPSARSRTAPRASHPAAPVPRNAPERGRSKRSGFLLFAGLVGLVGIGSSAILATRGDASSAAVTPAPEPATATGAPAAPSAPDPTQEVAPSNANTGNAKLAGYEESPGEASAFVQEGARSKLMDDAPDGADDPSSDGEADPEGENSAAEEAEATERREADDRAAAAKAARAKKRALARKARLRRRAQKRAARSAESSAVASKPEPKPTSTAAKSAPSRPAPSASSSSAPASQEAAKKALAASAALATSCRPSGGPSGQGKARISYANDGTVKSVEILTARFRETLTGSCVRMVFRRAKIPAFKGSPPTFIKSFTIPAE